MPRSEYAAEPGIRTPDVYSHKSSLAVFLALNFTFCLLTLLRPFKPAFY